MHSTTVTANRKLYLADRTASGFAPPRFVASLGVGRTLGAKYDPNGNLLLCSAPQGLRMLTHDNELVTLTRTVSPSSPLAAGQGLGFVNSVDTARDGTVYFSHSTDFGPYP